MNKIITSIAALSLAGFAFAAPANAQDATTDGAMGAETNIPEMLMFDAVDLDLSGDISFEEILEVDPGFSEQLYAQADVDGSGALTETEYDVLIKTGVLVAPMEG